MELLRLVALDEESSLLRAVSAAAELPVRAVLCSVPLVRAVVCSVRLALSPRESLLEVPPRKPSPPRLPESSRRSEWSECDPRCPGSAVAMAPGAMTSVNATVAPAPAVTTRFH